MAFRRLPPLRALEAFVRIVRLGSARAAAQELGLSPSALSRRVTSLEDFVGKKLFTRAHQAMKLTDDGKAFYEAIAALPPRRRQIFRLCKLDGKSYEEAALQLGLSTSTISDHIVKATHFIQAYCYTHHELLLVICLCNLFMGI